MKKRNRANASLLITAITGIILVVALLLVSSVPGWFPQFIVTLVGLIGASWFVGHRLDLHAQDIDQRQTSADAMLASSERAIFNGAIKEAVQMMSSGSSASVLAGQRWLHAIADVGLSETRLVQSLLCAHITNVSSGSQSSDELDSSIDARQSALDLLFKRPNCDRFERCDEVPDLGSTLWGDFDFTALDLRGSTFYEGDFTNARIVGTCLDNCDLRLTKWNSDVGGESRTFMRHVRLCGATASSSTFFNVDFNDSKFHNDGHRITRFASCTFRECDFGNSDWVGATFNNCKFIHCNFEGAIMDGANLDTPGFDGCPTATFDIVSKAKLKNPAGLAINVVIELRDKGLLD